MSPTISPRLLAGMAALIALAAASLAHGEPGDVGPSLTAIVDGREVALPVLKVDVAARIQGDLATVTITQTFANEYSVPIHARYVFPLPSDAAVYAMRLVSGDRMIEAEIRPKPEARAVYESAKRRGNQAALLEQHRPNVFTQEVANLVPGAPIRVELEYAHAVEKSGGDYRFHVPTVVGPRYLPPAHQGDDAGTPTREPREPGEPEALEVGAWNLPASAPVASPESVDRARVGLRIELDAGMPIRSLASPTHRIAIDRPDEERAVIGLADDRMPDDRDFELHYRLAGDTIAAGATAYAQAGGGFVSLLLEPPERVADQAVARREMVYVLDCSGSMAGTPIEASKRFMRKSLAALRPGDSFRIIRFSDSANEWSASPVDATPDAIAAGLAYVDGLEGEGGTEMASGIRAAFAPPVAPGTLRLVVFLTDGYIGNDIEIVRLLESRRGDARLFSFGVGSGVNRYLIQEMARVGRGAARIVRPDEDADAAADELTQRLASPVLTDIEIEWGGAPVEDVYPSQVPDLFAGQTVRVMAHYLEPGRHRVVIRGRVAGRSVALPVELDLPATNTGSLDRSALPILWARSQVEDLMIEYLSPASGQAQRDSIEREVTELGLAHRLATQWTSFVAVAKVVVNPGGEGSDADVAVPQAHGVPDSAYPPGALVAGNAGFTGHAGPEPASWLALLAIAAVASLWRWGVPGRADSRAKRA
jgi:Ca-activated chloride channel homolog